MVLVVQELTLKLVERRELILILELFGLKLVHDEVDGMARDGVGVL